jgi:hypothetical protein
LGKLESQHGFFSENAEIGGNCFHDDGVVAGGKTAQSIMVSSLAEARQRQPVSQWFGTFARARGSQPALPVLPTFTSSLAA